MEKKLLILRGISAGFLSYFTDYAIVLKDNEKESHHVRREHNFSHRCRLFMNEERENWQHK